MIYVTNNGKTDFFAEHACIKYEFPVGKTVEIPEKVASFIFGYGVDDKYTVLVRNGWLKMSNEYSVALAKLADFRFTTEPVKHHLQSPVIERVAPPPSKGGKGAKAQQVQHG